MKFSAESSVLHPPLFRRAGNWLGLINWQASPYAATQSVIALRDEDMREDAKAITVPVLLLHGVQDKIVPIALQAIKYFKNATLVKA